MTRYIYNIRLIVKRRPVDYIIHRMDREMINVAMAERMDTEYDDF